MAFPTFTPPVAASPGSKKTQQLKLLKNEFGDGYTQAVRQGYNHIRRTISLNWDALTRAQRDTIIAFLEARGGDQTFYYQHYDEASPRKYTCEQWDSSNPDGVFSVSAELVESFEFDS